MVNFVLGSSAMALYIVAGSLLGVRLSRANTGQPWNKNSLLAIGWSGALLHALILAPALLHTQGINLGFFNALSLTGLLVAVVLLLTSLLRPVETLGIILLPFSAATVLMGLWFPSERIVGDSTQWPLEMHILISILAYSILTLAAVQAVLLAIQENRLRNRQPGGFVRGIPPLMTMESLLFQMIVIGFILLSLALLSGLLFLEDIFAQHMVHKTVLSLAAWAVFGILLWGRWRFGWRGRKAIVWTLSGFATLALAYFGSKLVLELVLQR